MPAEINYLAIKDSLREDGNFCRKKETPRAIQARGKGIIP